MVFFTLNEVCKTLTGIPASEMELPVKQYDWCYVAHQLTKSGLFISDDRLAKRGYSPARAMKELGYSRREFQEKYKEQQTLSNLLYYLTGRKATEAMYEAEGDSFIYPIFALACAKCHIVKHYELGKISPSAWLRENKYYTLEQFSPYGFKKNGDKCVFVPTPLELEMAKVLKEKLPKLSESEAVNIADILVCYNRNYYLYRLRKNRSIQVAYDFMQEYGAEPFAFDESGKPVSINEPVFSQWIDDVMRDKSYLLETPMSDATALASGKLTIKSKN